MNDIMKKLLSGIPGFEKVGSEQDELQDTEGLSPMYQTKPNLSPDIFPSPLAYPEPSVSAPEIQDAIVEAKAAPVIAKPVVTQPLVQPKNVIPEKITPTPDLQSMLSNLTMRTPEDEELRQAQQQRNEDLRRNMMLKAGATLGNALVSRKPPTDYLSDADVAANLKVADVKDRTKASMDKRNQAISEIKSGYDIKKAALELGDKEKENDPSTELSKTATGLFNDFLKSAGYPGNIPPGTMSYSRIDQLMKTAQYPVGQKIRAEAEAASRADRREELDIRRDEGKATKDLARQDKLDKEAKLSAPQVDAISTFDKAIAAVDDIIAQKPKWDTGNLSFAQNKLAGFINMDDSEKSRFKSDVGEQLASYIKSISGATVSPTERAALLENVPSVYDKDETFLAKANALRKRLDSNRTIELQNLRKLGKDTKEFEKTPNVTTKTDDPRIDSFMKKNNIKNREEAIKILKDNGIL